MTSNSHTWSEGLPIYRQLVDQIIARILSGTYSEGELLPSVRQVAEDYSVNPITVTKAYNELSQYGLTEKRRGIGTIIKAGARSALLKIQQEEFLKHEWPQILERIQRLELDPAELLGQR